MLRASRSANISAFFDLKAMFKNKWCNLACKNYCSDLSLPTSSLCDDAAANANRLLPSSAVNFFLKKKNQLAEKIAMHALLVSKILEKMLVM